MSLSICSTSVDNKGRELVQQGSTSFPIACYQDNLKSIEVPWHWHEELEAGIITEGCAIVAVGNEKYTLHPGDGFFVNSEILHSVHSATLDSCHFHSLVFHPRLVGGSLDSIYYQNYVQPLMDNHNLEGLFLTPSVPWQADALNAIENAWQPCVHEPLGFEFKVRNALSELILTLQNNLPVIKTQSGSKAQRNGERIKWMLQYVHDHFADELNITKIAEAAAISESECLRCFKSTIGTTPIQYVRQYRITQACQMLATTHTRISDVAHLCGFQDLSYFTKTFREAKGCVPSEYRRQKQLLRQF